MDMPRASKSGAASAVSVIMLQKSRVPLEQVLCRAPAVIVDWSCSRAFNRVGLSKTGLESKKDTCEMSMDLLVPLAC